MAEVSLSHSGECPDTTHNGANVILQWEKNKNKKQNGGIQKGKITLYGGKMQGVAG